MNKEIQKLQDRIKALKRKLRKKKHQETKITKELKEKLNNYADKKMYYNCYYGWFKRDLFYDRLSIKEKNGILFIRRNGSNCYSIEINRKDL